MYVMRKVFPKQKSCLPMESFFVKLSVSLILLALIQMHGYQGCLVKERIGLLQLKSFFISISVHRENIYNIPIPNSWVDDPKMPDCCDWERVKCNATTQRVMQLSLGGLQQNVEDFIDGSPVLNLSLFLPFEELQSLDLSFNWFESVYKNKAFKSFGNLKQLKMLNLGFNMFGDSVLPYLNTLTSLTTLILSGNRIEAFKTKQGLTNLRNLHVLDLSGNSISAGSVTRLGIPNLTNLEALDLRGNRINGSVTRLGLGNLRKLKRLGLGGNKISGFPTSQGLANLTNLEVLQLSEINMSGSVSKLGLAKFSNLKALDLSYTGINGSLEIQGICELKNLIELNLEGSFIGGRLPQCLGNLTRLKVLDISLNQLSGSLPSVLANLTSLQYLDLSENYFEGTFSLSTLANHSNLEFFILSLENNLLQVKTENWLPTSQLKVLHLRNCNLHGTLNFLLKQHDLKYIDLSHNKLVGNFPIWLLENNTKLEVLRLANNSFTGSVKLPSSKLDFLHHLDISKNSFTGMLPQNMITILQKLVYLDMSINKFEGNISSSIGEMKELRFLDLSTNQFSGELSAPLLTGCFSLELLDLSHNNFYGQIFPKTMNLSQLSWLSLDHNNFSGKIMDGLLSSTGLQVLDISNNMLIGQIPRWIGNLSDLAVLSISTNLLEGNIPVQINNLEALEIFDVSENSLSGSMMHPFNLSSVKHLYMQKNSLCGSIPKELFRSSNLMTVDLRYNKFSGRIPHEINEHSELRVLLLRGNYLQGCIPNQMCQLGRLGIMDLSRNMLNGSIPSCFANVLFWRVGNDDLYGSQREYVLSLSVDSIGSYFNSSLDMQQYGDDYWDSSASEGVEVEFVTKNRYELYNGSNLNYMTGLDLSCNELTGEIPLEIGQLEKVRALNLSYNYLSGPIPESFSNLKMIESLDLSHNKLSGQIPPQLTKLNFLSNFNVSYNNLSGPTPEKGQFSTFGESSYRGNLGLCGPTIIKTCTRAQEIPDTTSNRGGEEEDGSAIDMVSFTWSFSASYVMFILGLFAILWLNSHWRRLWFYFIEACIDRCFYWLVKFVYFITYRARP